MGFPTADATLSECVRKRFLELCAEAGRSGAIAFTSARAVKLLPEQEQRLDGLLQSAGLKPPAFAASLALFYHPQELLAIPSTWQPHAKDPALWNRYARAYHEVNLALNSICDRLASEFGGVGEKATIDGWAGSVSSVGQYFPHCVSHRAFAEAAGLGWRGRHGLIVTPEAGPALRLATLFLSGEIKPMPQELSGCGECHACLEVCPILPRAGAAAPAQMNGDYRERCRRRISHLGLEADVCGVCVRVCWEKVTGRKGGVTP